MSEAKGAMNDPLTVSATGELDGPVDGDTVSSDGDATRCTEADPGADLVCVCVVCVCVLAKDGRERLDLQNIKINSGNFRKHTTPPPPRTPRRRWWSQ